MSLDKAPSMDILSTDGGDTQISPNPYVLDLLLHSQEKLDQILGLLSNEQVDDGFREEGTGVNISGSGMNMIVDDPVEAGQISDPFLMTGFDKKVVHLAHDSDEEVHFEVEVDFLGNGTWKKYETFNVPPRGYLHHEFPDGFSAHWARVRADTECRATVYFMYN